ncbi:MAG TPA: type II toxin-antitoxin system YafQ family toxin [Clostridia bacterium]|mgnify:CR=1 FL=1|nr:type II toxin-antitoxin system YafQ family toxin [Clostridia bacterium]
MKYIIKPTSKFQKDLKRMGKRGYDLRELTRIIEKLAKGEKLPEKNRDHRLSGIFHTKRECHLMPDWLLIYEVSNCYMTLYLIRTGSHSDLFD